MRTEDKPEFKAEQLRGQIHSAVRKAVAPLERKLAEGERKLDAAQMSPDVAAAVARRNATRDANGCRIDAPHPAEAATKSHPTHGDIDAAVKQQRAKRDIHGRLIAR